LIESVSGVVFDIVRHFALLAIVSVARVLCDGLKTTVLREVFLIAALSCMIVHVLWYGVLVYSVPKTYVITFIGQNDCHSFAYYDGMYTG